MVFTQSEILINIIERAIGNNEIRAEDIDENYIRRAANNLRENMKRADEMY